MVAKSIPLSGFSGASGVSEEIPLLSLNMGTVVLNSSNFIVSNTNVSILGR